MKTPYKPLLDTHDDTKHFDAQTLTIPVESPPGGGGHAAVHEEEEEYEGFTFEAQTVLSKGDAAKYEGDDQMD